MAHIDNHPPVKEADVYDRIRWITSEFKVQSRRLHEAASILETMRLQRSRAGVEAARETILKMHDQTTALIGSLDRAIAGRDATGRKVYSEEQS